jgi:nitrogen fixation/metabolism regulation signal transduction histidine kinase
MSFRARISLVIFLVSLLPTMAVLIFSTYLLSSTLNRVGASGLETALQEADTLIEQTQEAAARLMISLLPDSISWKNRADIDRWRQANRFDLAFVRDTNRVLLSSSDSAVSIADIIKLPSGLNHLDINDDYLLIYAKGDSLVTYGCGILMPPGYSRRGRELANSISASASLGMYKIFSLKLLAVATLLAIGLSIILGWLLSTIISRQLAEPLEKLNAGANIIGAGNLDHEVRLEGSDEFSHLADSFNKMAGEIKDNQRRLLESERLAAWREVARRIAHEIKNPLTPINIQLFRLEKQLQSALQGQEQSGALSSLEAIRSQITALQDLAQHFSTFAKEPELKRSSCSLKDIIIESVDAFRSYRGIEIVTDIVNDIPRMNLDIQMMKRVFVNLIKNSIEARPDGAKIEITAKCREDHINLTIRDNGPGIPSEKLERIDQPYITSKPTGTGLGLVIVKKIIEEHGGQIRFYSDNGAVAEIKLPK